MPAEPGAEQYAIVPKPHHPGMEVVGPFDTPREAHDFASHYYAGQVSYTVREICSPAALDPGRDEPHPSYGCGRLLALGQFFWCCGEDRFDTRVPLCTECGGTFALEDPSYQPKEESIEEDHP